MSDTLQEVTKPANVVGTTVLSIAAPTPKWATVLFRVFYHLSTGIAVWLAATKMVPEANKFEVLLVASLVDRVVWAVGRCLGVKKTELIQPDEQ